MKKLFFLLFISTAATTIDVQAQEILQCTNINGLTNPGGSPNCTVAVKAYYAVSGSATVAGFVTFTLPFTRVGGVPTAICQYISPGFSWLYAEVVDDCLPTSTPCGQEVGTPASGRPTTDCVNIDICNTGCPSSVGGPVYNAGIQWQNQGSGRSSMCGSSSQIWTLEVY